MKFIFAAVLLTSSLYVSTSFVPCQPLAFGSVNSAFRPINKQTLQNVPVPTRTAVVIVPVRESVPTTPTTIGPTTKDSLLQIRTALVTGKDELPADWVKKHIKMEHDMMIKVLGLPCEWMTQGGLQGKAVTLTMQIMKLVRFACTRFEYSGEVLQSEKMYISSPDCKVNGTFLRYLKQRVGSMGPSRDHNPKMVASVVSCLEHEGGLVSSWNVIYKYYLEILDAAFAYRLHRDFADGKLGTEPMVKAGKYALALYHNQVVCRLNLPDEALILALGMSEGMFCGNILRVIRYAVSHFDTHMALSKNFNALSPIIIALKSRMATIDVINDALTLTKLFYILSGQQSSSHEDIHGDLHKSYSNFVSCIFTALKDVHFTESNKHIVPRQQPRLKGISKRQHNKASANGSVAEKANED